MGVNDKHGLSSGRRWTAVVSALALVMGIFSVAVADDQPPTIAPIADTTVGVGQAAVIPVNVTAVAGANVNISVSGLPDFASFNAGTRRITLAPRAGDQGNYGPITVTATVTGQAPAFRSATSNIHTGVNATTLTIDLPAGTQQGDLLIAQIRYRGNEEDGGANLTPPTGWTPIGTIQGNGQSNHSVYYKVATASEPADYTFTQSVATGRMAGGIGAYSGVDTSDPINASAASGPDTGTSLEAPDVTTTHDNTAVLRLWGWKSAQATVVTVPGDVTERWAEQTGSDGPDRNRVLAGDEIQTIAGSVGVSTATTPGVLEDPNAFTVALNPAIRGGTANTSFNVTVEAQATDEDHFIDDDGHLFEGDINAIASAGITRGCNPPVNDRFCPDDTVIRGQMAAFIVRALGLTDNGGGDLFNDDDHSVFENDIDRLATAGVTRGCNPPVNDRFCPDDELTRGQMAAFLVRALGYTDDGGGDLFVDDDDSVFEGDIDRLAVAGVTRGCNPPANDRFCPDDALTRGQMAAFLARALIYGG